MKILKIRLRVLVSSCKGKQAVSYLNCYHCTGKAVNILEEKWFKRESGLGRRAIFEFTLVYRSVPPIGFIAPWQSSKYKDVPGTEIFKIAVWCWFANFAARFGNIVVNINREKRKNEISLVANQVSWGISFRFTIYGGCGFLSSLNRSCVRRLSPRSGDWIGADFFHLLSPSLSHIRYAAIWLLHRRAWRFLW